MPNQIKAWNDQCGATAVEFALVGPIFIALVIGILYMCIGLFTVGSLHYAVEEGARCWAVKSTVCTDAATTVAYTNSRYFGPGTSPNFVTDSTGGCGRSVSANLNYVMNLGIKQITVPITATACYPPTS